MLRIGKLLALLIFGGHNQFAVGRPLDGDGRVVPGNAALVLRRGRVIIGGFVEEFCRFAEHDEAVLKAFRYPQLEFVSADSSTATCCSKVGEDLRMLTATSNTSPCTTRTSLPCGCWIWYCKPRSTFGTEREWLSCTNFTGLPMAASNRACLTGLRQCVF